MNSISAGAQTSPPPCFCQFADPNTWLAEGIYFEFGVTMASPPPPQQTSCAPTSASVGGGPAQGECDPLSFICVFPTDGLHSGPSTVVVTCTGNNVSQQTAPAPIIVDVTPPVVLLTTAPANNSIVGINGPLVLGGTLSSISPTTVTYDGSSGVGAQLIAFVSSGPPGSISGPWEIDLDTPTIASLAISTGLTTIGVIAKDILQNEVAPSPRNGYAISVDPSLARQVYIDAAPPVVTFNSGSMGDITSLNVTSGTITDNLRLGTLSISIQELHAPNGPKYWSDTDLAWSSAPVQIPITINSGPNLTSSYPPGVVFSSWTYNRLTDANLDANQTYLLTASATDYAGNPSTTMTQFRFVAQGPYSNLNKLLLNTGGAVTFSPPNPAVTWGGFDTTSLSVTLNGLTPDQVTFNNDDGFLIVTWNGLTATVRSNPASCSRSGQINVYDSNGSIIAASRVTILAPTSSTANLQFHNLGTGQSGSVRIECDALNTVPLCRGDRWDPIYFNGDSAMNLNFLQQIEDQSQYRPLSGTRLPLCPIGGYAFATSPNDPFPDHGNKGTDTMFYHWFNTPASIKAFRNCGDSSTQSINFISTYSDNVVTGVHRCTFITGVKKTKRLDAQQNICTTRSDGVPNATCSSQP